jgi:predicted RNase H-like HicB family nuclease
MKNVYPAVFYNQKQFVGVVVPDIKGCQTFGENMADAIEMAEDAIALMIARIEDDGYEVPSPSTISQIEQRLKDGDIEIFGTNPEVFSIEINTDRFFEDS